MRFFSTDDFDYAKVYVNYGEYQDKVCIKVRDMDSNFIFTIDFSQEDMIAVEFKIENVVSMKY